MAAEDTTSKLELSEDEALAAKIAEDEQKKFDAERELALDSLARSIESKFFTRASQRKVKETQWRRAMELYLGNLSIESFVDMDKPFSETLQKNRPYYNIVANKCDIAIAQSVDMQFAGGEKNWSLSAATNSKDPLENEKARGMEKEIEAQLEHCSYGRKSRRAIEDRVIIGSGILKGPVNTGKVYNKYVMLDDGVTWMPSPAVDKQPSIERVNPWFFFPDDSVNEFCAVQDVIEVHPSSALTLKKWKTHPGFIPDAIDQALKVAPESYIIDSYADFADITDSNPYLFKNQYMVLEYHGPISASSLQSLSVEPPAYDPVNGEFYGEVWVVGGKVIRIELENIEASFEVPYALSTWKKDPASVFGYGSPLLMKDAQRVARETWRMILDNASLSSGPQVAIHKTYVEPQNNSWVLHPGKAWNLLDSSVDVEKAIQFFDVPNYTAALMPILDMASRMGEEESMTPMIAGGLQGADTQESATGQLIMKEASTTVLDFLSEDWDDNVTEKVIRRMYAWNMQYNPNPDIKGNYVVDVRTASEFKNKQMHTRDLERLMANAAQNPELAMALNMDELTRALMATMNIPYNSVVKSPEEVAAAREAAAQQPNPEQMKMQLEMQKLKVSERELDLKEAELAFEKQQQQAREVMEHEERLSANRARELEAYAQVVRTQNEKDIQFLQLAQKMESDQQRNMIMSQIAVRNDDTKRFVAQAQINAKARDQILTAEEMKIKKEQGTGI